MPWHVAKTAQCPTSKPWGVIKDSDGSVVPGGCHPTQAEANAHMAALYASEPGAKTMTISTDCGCDDSQLPHFRAASVDNSVWDAGAAMSNCAGKDSPAGCYGAICAGKKAGDPGTQQAWALPNHKQPGSPPNAAGVRNALARLPGTQGLTNAGEARTHLENHMKAINPD